MPAGDPFGDAMNGMSKVVVSTTLKSAAAWRNSTLISRNVVEEVHKLKEGPGKNILIDGSSVLIHTLAENDLVDEYILHVYPLVLGSGKRLFPEGKRTNLKTNHITSAPNRGRVSAVPTCQIKQGAEKPFRIVKQAPGEVRIFNKDGDMVNYICITCGIQHAEAERPPEHCPICEDERQYIGHKGQRWTTSSELQRDHHNRIEEIAANLTGIGSVPAFAIGQRALLVQTCPWQCAVGLHQLAR